MCTAFPSATSGQGCPGDLSVVFSRASPLRRCHSGTTRPACPQLPALPRCAPSEAARPPACSHATHLQAHPLLISEETSQNRLHEQDAWHMHCICVSCIELMPEGTKDFALLYGGMYDL